MNKIWIIGGGTLVGLLVVVVAAVYLSLGSMVADMVQSRGTELLGTPVTVDHVEVRPFDGYLSLRGLKIKNPRGFRAESIFTLAEVIVRVDVATLRSNLITVHQLTLVEPKIYYELESPEGNNLATLARNIKAYTDRQKGGAEADDDVQETAAAASGAGDDAEPKMVITNFEMLGAEVLSGTNVHSDALLQKFPDFRVQNVGGETGGATPADVAGTILGIISKRMTGM